MKLTCGIILTLFLLICIFSAGCQAAQVKSAANSKNEIQSDVNQEELYNAVMSFADNFVTTVTQATRILESELPSPKTRLESSRIKVYTFSSVIDIASSPSPGRALLDMVVTVTLNRMVWEEYWHPQVFGKPADVVVNAFKKTEEDIWSIAAMVLTSNQQKGLKDLILEWRQNNPDQIGVNYIRFSDFGNLGEKLSLSEIQQPGGLLAPVKEAAHAADEIRITAERTKYMLSRMQLIVNYQVELMFRELMFQPEFRQLLTDLTKFRKSMGHFAELMELLPKQITTERDATIRQAAKELAKERETALTDFAQIIEKERSALLAGIEEREAGLNKDIEHIILEFNTLAEHRIDHVFNRLIQLIVILSICLLIIVVVHHLLSKRSSS